MYVGNKKAIRGWPAILDRYHEVFKSGEVQMGTLALQDTEINPFAKDSALVWASGGLYTLVMRRFPEGWRTTL